MGQFLFALYRVSEVLGFDIVQAHALRLYWVPVEGCPRLPGNTGSKMWHLKKLTCKS